MGSPSRNHSEGEIVDPSILKYNSYCFHPIKLVSVLLTAWEPIVLGLTVERFQNVPIQELTTNASTDEQRSGDSTPGWSWCWPAGSPVGGKVEASVVSTVHWYCEQRAGSSPQAIAGVEPNPTSSAPLIVRQN